jgi:cobalt-zinc-cadmium resistance protein CzcA
MQEAVNFALDKNNQIKAAKFRIEKEEAGKLSAVNIPKPKIFVEYEGVKGSLSNFESRKLGISQDFEFPTVYFNQVSVQDYEVNIAQAEYDNLVVQVRSDVKKNYIHYLYQTSLLDIASENLGIYEGFVYIANRKYEEGAGENLELLSARVNRLKFENLIENLKSEIINTQVELSRLMNVDLKIIPAGKLAYKEYNLTREELLRTAMINNSRLKIIRYKKLQSDSRVSLEISRVLPDFSIRYYRQVLGSRGGFYGFEVGIGIPLWFWWEQSGNIQQADLELKSINSEELNLSKIIEAEVITAFEKYENSLRQLTFFNEGALAEAEEIVRTARTSYEVGAADYSEYLQALNVANEAMIQYIEALFNYNISIINLESLTGKEIL